MPCSLIDPLCVIKRGESWVGHLAGGAAHAVASDFLNSLANGMRDAANWLYTDSATWWVKVSSPDLVHESAISTMQNWLLPVTAAVAVGGMLAAGLRMVLTRKHAPLLDAASGLAALSLATTVGTVVPNLLLRAGDTWSNWILNLSGHQFAQQMTQLVQFSNTPAVFVIVFGLVAMVLGAVQFALLIFRQASVIILAAVLPLAAAGVTAPLTRSWIRKVVSWMLALIMYKPAAAAVYATAFTLIGNSENLQSILTGFVMLGLSLLALPALMRFFTWTTGAISSGGGGQLLGMAAAGAVALGAMRGSAGGGSAGEHASYLSSARQSPATSEQPSSVASGASVAPADAPPGQPESAKAGGAAASGGADSRSGVPASAATAAATGGAGAAMAAMFAASSLASGARGAAASATEDGEQR